MVARGLRILPYFAGFLPYHCLAALIWRVAVVVAVRSVKPCVFLRTVAEGKLGQAEDNKDTLQHLARPCGLLRNPLFRFMSPLL